MKRQKTITKKLKNAAATAGPATTHPAAAWPHITQRLHCGENIQFIINRMQRCLRSARREMEETEKSHFGTIAVSRMPGKRGPISWWPLEFTWKSKLESYTH